MSLQGRRTTWSRKTGRAWFEPHHAQRVCLAERRVDGAVAQVGQRCADVDPIVSSTDDFAVAQASQRRAGDQRCAGFDPTASTTDRLDAAAILASQSFAGMDLWKALDVEGTGKINVIVLCRALQRFDARIFNDECLQDLVDSMEFTPRGGHAAIGKLVDVVRPGEGSRSDVRDMLTSIAELYLDEIVDGAFESVTQEDDSASLAFDVGDSGDSGDSAWLEGSSIHDASIMD